MAAEHEESLLETACDLLKHDWVKSFLFPTDKSTYVRQLHHALSQQTAITASVHFGTLSSSVGPCQSLAGLNKQLSVLCVPSFSTGKITVGFEITECLADASPHPLGVPRYVGRYVRDDDEGLMLIIAEHPHLGVTEVTCCTLLSPGCRSQVYAVMNQRKLRSVVSNLEYGKGYNQAAMRRATLFAYSSVDMRTCPNCGSNKVGLCACRLKVKRKAHPLDHDTELQNLSTYTGDFGGLAKIKVVSEGQDAVATFVSKIRAIFTCDRENQRNLSKWAMTNAFSTEPVRLENYCMPGEPLLIEMGEGSEDTTAADDRSSSRDVLGQRVRRSEKRKRGDDGRDGSVRRGIRRTPASDCALDSALFTNATRTPEQSSPCTPVQEGQSSVRGSENMNTLLATDGVALEGSVPVSVSSIAGPPRPPLPPRPPPIRRTAQQSIDTGVTNTSQISNIQGSASQRSVTSQVGIGLQPIQGSLSNGMLLLPVRSVYQAVVPIPQGGVPLAPASMAPLAHGCRVYRDTRTRDEIRRARNRAAAQRSNEKKKREVAKLKDDLEESVKRKEALVERERVLRHENALLRAALGECGVAV